MAVEVYSLVTATIDRNFLNNVMASISWDRSVIEQLLCGMSNNLKCWQNDDESWQISGCLNNIVEAGANLLALYMRAQAAARDNNSAIDLPLSVSASSTDAMTPGNPGLFVTKTEVFDGEDDQHVEGSSQKVSGQEYVGDSGEVATEDNNVVGMRTRQSSRPSAHRFIYKHQKSHCCRMCKKSFSSSTNLRRHVRANHESGRFQCQYCPCLLYTSPSPRD